MWKTPTIKEIAVGLEINCYACAEIQYKLILWGPKNPHTYNGVIMIDLQTPKVFSLEIEKIAKEKEITHMDAVLLFCKDNNIEPEKVSSLITKGLKEKIEANARELNFLPKVARLPI